VTLAVPLLDVRCHPHRETYPQPEDSCDADHKP
jgi:hypothetical protein